MPAPRPIRASSPATRSAPARHRPNRVQPRTIRSVFGSILALILAWGMPAPATADGTPPPPPLADTTFYGRGYGHGVGMAQYGARGRALAGQTAEDILAHYYVDTTLGTRDPTTNVRVLLLTGFSASLTTPLTIVGKLGNWTIDGIAQTFPAGARAMLWPKTAGSTTWKLRVRAADDTLLYDAAVTTGIWVRPSTGSVYLQLVSKATTTNVYRGSMRIRLATTAQVVNHVRLDLYLRGVVPLEMPSSWPVEALKAQAIAARSYAVSHLHPSTGTFDVYDDTRSQVYRGKRAETSAGNAVISATAGVVLMSGSAVANAVFHSSDGGATENNENVWTSATGEIVGSPVPYLRGVDDHAPDGTAYDQASPYATWKTATYSGPALSAILGSDPRTDVGMLTALDLSSRGVSGRLIRVTLTGELGTKTVSGEVFRAVFNAGRPAGDPMLRSTLFDTSPLR